MARFFYDFCNVIVSKGGRRKTVICYFKRISGKFASILDYSALAKKLLKISVFSLKSVT